MKIKGLIFIFHYHSSVKESVKINITAISTYLMVFFLQIAINEIQAKEVVSLTQ